MEDIDEPREIVFQTIPLNTEYLLNAVRTRGHISSTRLELANKRLTEIDAIALESEEDKAKVTIIIELALYSNFIAKVHPKAFTSFANLAILNLSANELTSIPDLTSVPGCKELYLSSNKITKIQNLEAVPNLEVLDLRANKIKVVENLDANKKLKRVSISCNTVDKIEDLPALPELVFLGLYGNNVTSLDKLLDLLPIRAPNLETVLIEGNPVFHHTDLATIRSRLAASMSRLMWIDKFLVAGAK